MLKTKNEWNLLYWTKESKEKNFGDYLGQIYFDLAGVKVREEGRPCFTIGTVLSQFWWDRINLPILVWGSGSCGFDLPAIRNKDRITCVRGPLTKKWLSLPEKTPMGDPALLLTRLYSPAKKKTGPTKIFNYSNHEHGITTKIFPDQWKSLVDSIANAEIVLANTLHAAIVAQAYGVPWAMYQFNEENPLPLRWKDWFAYLGLPASALQPASNEQEAFDWWDKWKGYIEIRSIEPLIESCPWSQLRKIIK